MRSQAEQSRLVLAERALRNVAYAYGTHCIVSACACGRESVNRERLHLAAVEYANALAEESKPARKRKP